MRNRTVPYFEARISKILSRNPNISDINEVAILALRKQNHSDLNEYYLDCALATMLVHKQIMKKDNQTTLLAA